MLDWVPAISGPLAVVDLGFSEDEQLDLPVELSQSVFSSKLFLVWDPNRTVANMALDLHIGAHVKMMDGGVQPWHVNGAQDVIGSIGGVQALIPLFQTFLSGGVEATWFDDKMKAKFDYDDIGTFSKEVLCVVIPDLLNLVASFAQDHGGNARELLRCGGIDVIENCLLASRRVALNNNVYPHELSLFGYLTACQKLSFHVVESLLRLRSACSHYTGLETKVFARLLFNIPLWFGGVIPKLGVSLDYTLLPVLSALASVNPDKVRDCVGINDTVLLLKSYVTFEDETVGHLRSLLIHQKFTNSD